MPSLWPYRMSENVPAEETLASGTIEMKGSNRTEAPKKSPASWLVHNSRSKSKTGEGEQGSGLQLPEACLDQPFLEAILQADRPAILKCSPRGVEYTPKSDEAEIEGSANQRSRFMVSVNEGGTSSAENRDFNEVKIIFRMPKPQQQCDIARAEANCPNAGELQEELVKFEARQRKAEKALSAKTQEVEDLLRIIRELTESRNRLSNIKTVQAERMADLHHDYMRVMRVADLSRALSKENLSKAAEVTQKLNKVEEELARTKLMHQKSRERNTKLKLDNLELREKICLLERLDVFAYHHESACMLKFKQFHLKETY